MTRMYSSTNSIIVVDYQIKLSNKSQYTKNKKISQSLLRQARPLELEPLLLVFHWR